MEKDKRALRIVYMGTPEFAVAGLKKIIEEGYTVVGVITAPDRPAGRGQRLRESELKTFAKSKGLTVLQPTNLKDEAFLEALRALKANLQVVVAFRMLPKVVWQMPQYGTFNLHASLLPQYRGAAPINWAIMNGETETGVTTFFIDEKIDTGEVILQEKTTIQMEENAGQLHDKLMHLGAEVILKTIVLIENDEVLPVKQQESDALKPAHKIHKETCQIDWSWPMDKIYNHIRGLSPYPTAWTTLTNGETSLFLKLYRAEKLKENHKLSIGTVVSDGKKIKIAVKDGSIEVEELQLSGKKRMKAQELLNGFKLHENAYVR